MFDKLYTRIIEEEDIFKASTPKEGERRKKKYTKMMIDRFKGSNESLRSFLFFLKSIEDNFTENLFSSINDLEEFKKDYLSEKYIWEFKLYEVGKTRNQIDQEIVELQKNGWKKYKDIPFVLYKEYL